MRPRRRLARSGRGSRVTVTLFDSVCLEFAGGICALVQLSCVAYGSEVQIPSGTYSTYLHDFGEAFQRRYNEKVTKAGSARWLTTVALAKLLLRRLAKLASPLCSDLDTTGDG